MLECCWVSFLHSAPAFLSACLPAALLYACHAGGDPYLAALYRRCTGCVRMLPDVTVINRVGGVQRADKPYTEPRYERTAVDKQQLLDELRGGTARVLQGSRLGTHVLAGAVTAGSAEASLISGKPSAAFTHDSSSSVDSARLAPCGDSCPDSSGDSKNNSSETNDSNSGHN